MSRASGWYRGWTMVGIGIAMVMLSVGSVLYGYGVYVTPVARDLGLSREAINTGIVCQHLGTACLTPLIGRMLDRVRVSIVVALSGVAMGAGLAGLSVGDMLWPKAALLALPISFGFSGAGSIASYVLVARWFRLRRGRMMAIVALGQTGGSVVLAPAVAALIASVGWRQALLCQAAFVAAALLLLAWAIVDTPRPDEREPGADTPDVAPAASVGSGAAGHPLPLATILSSPVFWALAVVVALTLAVVQATIVSLVPLATARGIPPVKAATLLSLLGLSDMAGKILLAFVADRVDRRTLMVAAVAIVLAFALSLTFDLGYVGLAIACSLAGMALGGFFPIYSALLADRFGPNSLGSTEGLVSPAIALVSALAVYVAGASFDASGNYRHAFLLFAGALAAALVLAIALRIRTPGQPVERTT